MAPASGPSASDRQVWQRRASVSTAGEFDMGYFTKRYHPPGTSPGTFAQPARPPAAPLRIRLIDHTDPRFLEREDVSPDDCVPFLESDTITWIHLQGEAEPDVLRRDTLLLRRGLWLHRR